MRRSVPIVVALLLAAGACSQSDEATPETTVAVVEEAWISPWDLDAALAADPDCVDPLVGDGLVIGYAADSSAYGAVTDVAASAAAERFVKQINCSGGVDGTPVTFVSRDASAAQELIDAGAHAILGPRFQDAGLAVLRATNGRVPVIFTGSTEPTLANLSQLAFLDSMDDTAQAGAAAEFALQQGWRTAVTFSAPGPYFGYNPEVFTEVFEAGGGTVQRDFSYVPVADPDAADPAFADSVAEIAAGDPPDVIYSAMPSFQLVSLVARVRDAGVDPAFISTDAFEATGGYDLAGLEGVFHTAHVFGPDNARYQLVARTSTNPTFAALAVDGIAVIIDAYLRAESNEPALIGAAMAESNDVQAVTSVLSYDGNASPSKTVFIQQVVDGAPTLVGRVEN